MTGGTGDTFAIIRGTVTPRRGQPTAVKFTIDPTHFTLAQGQVHARDRHRRRASGSTVKPQIVSVNNPNGKNVDPTHSRTGSAAPGLPSGTVPAGSATTAVLAPVQFDHKNPNGSVTYTVNVKGLSNTSGQFLLGFYLPGDANGDGKVDTTDVAATKAELGVTASNANYTFDADANRDGRINSVRHVGHQAEHGREDDDHPDRLRQPRPDRPDPGEQPGLHDPLPSTSPARRPPARR